MCSDPDYEEYMADWRSRVDNGSVSIVTHSGPSVALSDEHTVPPTDAWELRDD